MTSCPKSHPRTASRLHEFHQIAFRGSGSEVVRLNSVGRGWEIRGCRISLVPSSDIWPTIARGPPDILSDPDKWELKIYVPVAAHHLSSYNQRLARLLTAQHQKIGWTLYRSEHVLTDFVPYCIANHFNHIIPSSIVLSSPNTAKAS